MMSWFARGCWGLQPFSLHLGGAMGLLFLAAVGVIVYLVVRNETRKREAGGAGAETPLEIAKKRYARGEITREDFQRLKDDLS